MNIKLNSVICIVVILLFFSNVAKATKLYTGYIITNENDTLYGKIKMVSPTYNELNVKFIDEYGKKKKYSVQELKQYAFLVPIFSHKAKAYVDEWVYAVRKTVETPTVPTGTKEALLEQRVEGSVDIYNHYTEVRANIGQRLQHFYYAEKEGSIGFTKLTKDNYEEVLKAMMSDYPDLEEKIGTPGYGYKYIPKMATVYNEAITKEVSPFLEPVIAITLLD